MLFLGRPKSTIINSFIHYSSFDPENFWSEIGAIDAHDQTILQWAKNNHFIVFTHDLDFGTLLAAGGSKCPSVIQVRTQNITPEAIAKLVTNAIHQFAEELARGALISINPRKSRARLLPLK